MLTTITQIFIPAVSIQLGSQGAEPSTYPGPVLSALSFSGGGITNERGEPDRRVAGMPSQDGGRRLRIDATEPRALGLPLSWFGTTEPTDLRWVRHPYRWLRWRSEVRRRGPCPAPRFEDFRL